MTLDLAQWDAESPTAPPSHDRPPAVPNGIMTLRFADGSHRTFRIHTKKANAKFAPGQRVLSLLIGPDNSSDYEGIAFVEDDGFKLWKRHKGTKVEKHAILLWMMLTGCEADGHELLVSKTCLKCNRLLTDPESIRLNYGPTCRGG